MGTIPSIRHIVRTVVATAAIGLIAAMAGVQPAMAAQPPHATLTNSSSVSRQLPTASATPTPAPTPDLTSPTFLLSSTPKTVVVDVKTGQILSVRLGEPASPQGLFPSNFCNSDTGCYFSNVPYPDYGFSAAGVYNGSWPARQGFSSGAHTVSACSVYTCYGALGPRSGTIFSGGTATGTQFTVYS